MGRRAFSLPAYVYVKTLKGIAYFVNENKLLWLVWHKRHRVSIRRFSEGFVPTPTKCPRCGELVDHKNDFTYSFVRLAEGVKRKTR